MDRKITSSFWILILALPSLFLGCGKDKNPPISQQRIWDCHHEMTWDSAKVNDHLVGEWEWEYIGCYWTPDKANNDQYKGLTIEFKTGNTLEVKENGQVTQTSTWKVADGDADLFELEVEPPMILLYGRILFCGKQVEFNDSYRDGYDNYFRRKE